MRRPPVLWLLAGLAVFALVVFVGLTVVVATGTSLALDTSAFHTADDLRTPWLDQVARVVTALGLIAIVGPVLVLTAAFLGRRRDLGRAAALVAGGSLTWVTVWIVKAAVDRARPPKSLIHTAGQSYPSAHAANSVGWVALAIALTVAIPSRRARIVVVLGGALVAVLVGLSRIYLRAHYASDVVAGEALAIALYSLTATGSLLWGARRDPDGSAKPPASTRTRPA